MSIELEIRSNSLQARKDLEKLNKSVNNIEKQSTAAGRAINRLLTAVSVTVAINGIRKASDEVTSLNNRIALTTGRTRELIAVQNRLIGVSRRSNTSLAQSSTLYSSLANNVGLARDEAIRLTEVLQKAGAIGGGSTETIKSALIQLQQGLAAGQLRGQELNSVLEGTPRIARAIAEELAVGIGELKALAEQGQITAEVVSRALLNSADKINAEFGQLDLTIGQAFQVALGDISNAFGIFLKSFSSGNLPKTIISIGRSIARFIDTVAVGFRVVQTELLLLKLELGSLSDIISARAISDIFSKIISGIDSAASKVSTALEPFINFATNVKEIFFDLFMYVVGNSVFIDLVDGIVGYSSNITGALDVFRKFGEVVRHIFWHMYDEIIGNSTFVDLVEGVLSYSNKVVRAVGPFSLLGLLIGGAISGAIALVTGSFEEGFAFLEIYLGKLLDPVGTIIDAVETVSDLFDTVVDKIQKSFILFKLTYGEKAVRVLRNTAATILDLGAALIGNILLSIAIPALAFNIGSRIGFGIIAVLGAFFKGFSENFELENVTDPNLLFPSILKELERQTNLLSTISTGIGAAITSTASVFSDGVIADLGKIIGDNILEILVTLFLSKNILTSGGSFLSTLLFADPGRGTSNIASATGQLSTSTFLSVQEDLNKIDGLIQARQEAFAQSATRLSASQREAAEASFDKEIKSLRDSRRELQRLADRTQGVYRNAQGIVNESSANFANSVGRSFGSVGSIIGSIFAAGYAKEIGDTIGLNSGEAFVAIVVAAKVGEILGGGLLGFIGGRLGAILASVFLVGNTASILKARFALLGTTLATSVTTATASAIAILGIRLKFFAVTAATLFGRTLTLSTFFVRLPIIVSNAVSVATAASLVIAKGVLAAARVLVVSAVRAGIAFIGAIIGGAAGLLLILGTALAALLLSPTLRQGIAEAIADAVFAAVTTVSGWIKAAETFASSVIDSLVMKLESIRDVFVDIFNSIFDPIIENFRSLISRARSLIPFMKDEEAQGYASGGYVRGPGTATSDSIAALLSDGEFVVRSKVATKYRPFLEQLNRTGQLPRFNTGGSVSSSLAAGAASLTSNAKDIFSELIANLEIAIKDLIGEEAFNKIADVFQRIKDFFVGGFGSSEENNSGFTTEQGLADAISGIIERNNENLGVDVNGLVTELQNNGRLTGNLISLVGSLNKVNEKIATLTERGDPVPLELKAQLAAINDDIVRQLGELITTTSEVAENTRVISQFAKNEGVENAAGFKNDVQQGLTGLLKGDIGLKDFGQKLLESFSTRVIDSFTTGITQSLLGPDSFLGKGIADLFGSVTQTGQDAGGFLDKKAKGVSKLGIFGGTSDPADAIEGTGIAGGEQSGAPGAGFLASLKDTFGGVIQNFSGIFSNLSGSLSGIFDGLLGGFGNIFSSIGSIFGGGAGGGLAGAIGGLAGLFFHNGGLVPDGGGYTKMNGSEMVLTEAQQGELFSMAKGANSSNSNQVVNNITINGDISRQTKKEILQMIPTIAGGVNNFNRENS